MTLKRPNKFVLTAILTGWSFDFLFWKKMPGISFPIFVFIVLAVGFYLARGQELKPAKNTLWLLLPISFFSIMTIVRMEPMTRFLNFAATLFLMSVLAHSFLGGKWWLYTFKDYFIGVFNLGIDALFRQLGVLTDKSNRTQEPKGKLPTSRRILAVVRGLLLALPIVLILTSLLANADPIFEKNVSKFLKIFEIENLQEYIFRGIYIFILAHLLMGIYLHAFYKNHDENITAEEKSGKSRFLGFTEASIVLSSVNLLFLAFVIIQFQYFFGGQSNVAVGSYTFSEYAVRGFSELVAVAFISLLMFLVFSTITIRKTLNENKIFSGLGVLLVSLVTVILVSSFKRLQLYESAYGFTRLRTYTHVFTICLGLLLLGVVILELTKRQRHFTFAFLIAGLFFVVFLNFLNVDGFIARQNYVRINEGNVLDVGYLASLSTDVVPVLAEIFGTEEQPEAISGALACHALRNENYEDWKQAWQSFHFSLYSAQNKWDQLDSSDRDSFQVQYDGSENLYNAFVIVDGENLDCWSGYGYGYGWD